MTPVIEGWDSGYYGGGKDLGQAAAAAVVGGTTSVITGGKFANGAITAAYANLYNAQRGAQQTQESSLATSYAESNGEGWVDEWGNVYSPDPNFHNPEPGLEGVYPEALLPIGRAVQGAAHLGKAGLAATGRFLGPKGPVFGNSFFRGPGNSGLLNHGKVRLGWSYNAKTDRLNFSLRVGKWHSDKHFNPISIRAPAD